jgi:hypothetical protein
VTEKAPLLNYNTVSTLPPLVRSFCFNNSAWIMGSAALYLLELKEELPRDWDILVPFWSWGTACRTIPEGAPTNSHGGIKFKDGNVAIDVWAGDVGWFLSQVPSYPAYGVHPKSMTFIAASNQMVRVKS